MISAEVAMLSQSVQDMRETFSFHKDCGCFADANTLKMQARLQEERKQRAIHDKKEAEALAENLLVLPSQLL